MHTVTAFGRRFDVGPNDRLLDREGRETRFPVMELEIHMEGARGREMFDDYRPGDHVAEYGANRDMNNEKALAEYYVLVRDGRAVEIRGTHGIMID